MDKRAGSTNDGEGRKHKEEKKNDKKVAILGISHNQRRTKMRYGKWERGGGHDDS